MTPFHRRFTYLSFVLAIGLFSFCSVSSAQIQDPPLTLDELASVVGKLDQTYAPKAIQTVEAADAALAQVEPTQRQLQAWYIRTQHTCYERFFVNSCLDNAKLSRRKHSVILQRISVEAKAYKRKEHIEELDAELKLKNEQKQLDEQKKQ